MAVKQESDARLFKHFEKHFVLLPGNTPTPNKMIKMTHSFYLQMYLDNTLVDEVPLNYNGLQSSEEQQWYHLGAVQDLRELHEVLLMGSETEPVFVIRNELTT